MRKFMFLLFAALVLTKIQAQEKSSVTFINVLIDADQKIMVEQESVRFDQVQDAVKAILYNQPFRINQKLVFRIYGDESLPLGVITDVENEAAKGLEGVVRRRYLLNTQELNPDGEDWLHKVRKLNLKAIEEN